jgi:uncharacterized SAM-binding protein YcdF (DUF218 family)
MKGILSQIIMPLPFLFLLITAGFFLLIAKRRKTGRIIFMISFVWFLIISTRPVPHLLAYKLEKKYHQLADSVIDTISSDINVIVLGAGFSDDRSLSPNNQLSSNALGRLVEGIRVFNKLESLEASLGERKIRLVLSGYAGKLSISQAEVLFRAAVLLGADSANLLVSPKPTNTKEEADEYLKICGSSNPVIVVTDAVHMPRAILNFRKAGLKVIPAPANFLIKHGSVKDPWRWLPSTNNIKLLESSLHEYLGLIWVRAGGK